MTQEEIQAIRAMMNEVVGEHLEPVKADMATVKGDMVTANKKLDTMQEDISMLKEESAITRHSTNLLLKWAEKADRSVNVGLFE